MKPEDMTLKDIATFVLSLDHAVTNLRDSIQHLAEHVEHLGRQVDDNGKMADRLVQMAMVQTGDARAAVAHRSQSRVEAGLNSGGDTLPPVTQTSGDSLEPWPPKGSDVVRMP